MGFRETGGGRAPGSRLRRRGFANAWAATASR